MRQTTGYVSLLAAGFAGAVLAADHVETPLVTADPAGDIADVYLWRPDPAVNKIALAMTFGGRSALTAGGVRIDGPSMFCDRNVVYVFNIDNSADGNLDALPDIQVIARLARNASGECAFRFENVPGAGGRVISAREGQIATDNASGLRGFAGLVEDPFFFDTIGFAGTNAQYLQNSPAGGVSLITSINTDPPQDSSPFSIRSTVDGFAARNISGIIFEMDLATVTGGNAVADPTIQVWGETRRFAGTTP